MDQARIDQLRSLYPHFPSQVIEGLSREFETASSTSNPLFLWESLLQILLLHSDYTTLSGEDVACVDRDVAIPREIADYLLKASFSIWLLSLSQTQPIPLTKSWAEKIRQVVFPLKNTGDILRLVPRALGFGGSKKTSSFSHMREIQQEILESTLYDTLVSSEGVSRDEALSRISRAFMGPARDRQQKRITNGRNFSSGRIARKFRSSE